MAPCSFPRDLGFRNLEVRVRVPFPPPPLAPCPPSLHIHDFDDGFTTDSIPLG